MVTIIVLRQTGRNNGMVKRVLNMGCCKKLMMFGAAYSTALVTSITRFEGNEPRQWWRRMYGRGMGSMIRKKITHCLRSCQQDQALTCHRWTTLYDDDRQSPSAYKGGTTMNNPKIRQSSSRQPCAAVSGIIYGPIDVQRSQCSALHWFQSSMEQGTNQHKRVRDTVSGSGMTCLKRLETKRQSGPRWQRDLWSLRENRGMQEIWTRVSFCCSGMNLWTIQCRWLKWGCLQSN
jgi:hypothetical protein